MAVHLNRSVREGLSTR